MKRIFLYLIILYTIAACQDAQVPNQYSQSQDEAPIYPKYQDVTVPVNIAPLTFALDTTAEQSVARLKAGQVECILQGPEFCPSAEDWNQLKEACSDIDVEIYCQQNSKWTRMRPFQIHVSKDSIDPYIAYRLISPSYVDYEDITLCQRCLENYDEKVIYGNMINSEEKTGQCVNCHNFQQYNPNRMQFHVRQNMGGTVITYDGDQKKVDLRVDSSMVSAGVYPAWHPTEPLIVYSTNTTFQTFHTRDLQKIEVQDSQSDLILYDLKANKVTQLERDSDELDCFPCWSPDGKWLYYCSAHYTHQDTTKNRQMDLIAHYQDIRYNLYRRSFDPKSRTFSKRQLVYNADSLEQSATLPRISPDGRWLLFTQGPFGIFHIWHREADLYLMNLQSQVVRPLTEVNSPDVDSYHSWSSNGRWIIFSSRRDDGNYTRPFIAHMDAKGHATKPFELPSQEPFYHRQLLRSYNVPEFIKGPVSVSPQELARIIRQPAQKAM